MQGLGAFESLIASLEAVAFEMPQVIDAEIEKVLPDIEAYNRDQLQKGERPDETLISPPYRPFTIEKKKSKGQPYSKVTLFDEGDFYKSIKAKKYSGYVEVHATDWKTETLLSKYGEVLGLSDVHREQIQEELIPYLLTHIKTNYLP